METARSLKQTEEMCDNYETFDDFTLDSANALKDLRELDFVRRKKFRKSKKIDNKSRILLSAYNCFLQFNIDVDAAKFHPFLPIFIFGLTSAKPK